MRKPSNPQTLEFVMEIAKAAGGTPVFCYSEPGCGGTGFIECFCAGDFCACELQGESPCPGCQDCMDMEEEL